MFEVEVRETVLIGETEPSLDEVVLTVNGKCLAHLEQLDDNQWYLGIGDIDGQMARVILHTKRAKIKASWDNEGKRDCNYDLT